MFPTFLIKPLIYLVAAAAIAFFLHHLWTGFKDSIGAPYAAAQRKVDQPLIDKANAAQIDAETRATHAQADTDSCKAGAETQSAAIAKESLRADNAQKASAAIIAAAKRDAAAHDSEFRRLAAIAAARPKTDQSCADALSKADATLRPVLKDRQGAPK